MSKEVSGRKMHMEEKKGGKRSTMEMGDGDDGISTDIR